MSTQRHKPEEIVTKLRQVEVLRGQGMAMADAVRQIGVSELTYYRWRKQYGGMSRDQLRQLKDLQKENERLRKAVADLTLDKLILSEAARGNFCAPRGAVPASIMFAQFCRSAYRSAVYAAHWGSIAPRSAAFLAVGTTSSN